MRLALLSLVLLTACSKDPGGIRASGIHLAVVAGDLQIDTVAQQLDQPIVAKATDSVTAKPTPNVVINWFRVVGTDSVFIGAGSTNDSGFARYRPTLAPKSGSQTIVAWALDNEGRKTVYAAATATALPGVASKLFIVAPDTSRFNTTVSLEYGYQDAYGNATRGCADPDLVGWEWASGITGVGIDATKGSSGYLFTTNPNTTWVITMQFDSVGRRFVHAQVGSATYDDQIRAYAPSCNGAIAKDSTLLRS